MSNPDNTPGDSSRDTPIDWIRFPELVRATTFGSDMDANLVDGGLDPSQTGDDPPLDT